MVAHSEKDDHRSESNSSLPGCRKDIVVLSPELEVSLANDDPRDPSWNDSWPDVSQVVWRPDVATAEDDDGVELCKPVRLGKLAGGVVVDDGEGQSDWECSEEGGVHAAPSKDSLRCERAKEYSGGEVRLDTGASEAILLVRLTDVADVEDLEVHDCGTNKRGDNSY